MSVKVSVCMPVFNTDKQYLKKAIESILNQTYKNFEFIILNDGSTKTYIDDIINRYKNKDNRIIYIKNSQNLGISKARNMMINLSKGKYIANMDHDDISFPARLQKQIEFMEQNENVGVCGTAYKKIGSFLNRGIVRYPADHFILQATLIFKCVIHHPSAMYRKEVLAKHNIKYDENLISVNDRKIFLEISKYAKLSNLKEVLGLYRIHNSMTSKVQRNEITKEQKHFRKELFELTNVVLSQEEESIFNEYIVNGRNRIKNGEILSKINNILEKLYGANKKNLFFNEGALGVVCAKYLLKRCVNGAIFGFVSSKDILNKTTLPLPKKSKQLIFLKFMNAIFR